MAQVPIEELLRQCRSMYKLVGLASKRAKELADGASKLTEVESKKAATIALEEIRAGKVFLEAEEGEERAPAKSSAKRTARAKKKKA